MREAQGQKELGVKGDVVRLLYPSPLSPFKCKNQITNNHMQARDDQAAKAMYQMKSVSKNAFHNRT